MLPAAECESDDTGWYDKPQQQLVKGLLSKNCCADRRKHRKEKWQTEAVNGTQC